MTQAAPGSDSISAPPVSGAIPIKLSGKIGDPVRTAALASIAT